MATTVQRRILLSVSKGVHAVGIENPSTYAEWYWANQVDANKSFADAEEASLAPFISPLIGYMEDLEGMPPEAISILRAIGTPGHFGHAEVAKSTVVEVANKGINTAISPLWRLAEYAANKKFPTTIADMNAAIDLARRKEIDHDKLIKRGLYFGYPETEVEFLYEAQKTHASLQDNIAWHRFMTGDDGVLEILQTHYDINADDFAIWDWLTRPLFGVQDIQAMFVRGLQTVDETTYQLKRLGWGQTSIDRQLDLAYAMPTPTIMIQAGLQAGLEREAIKEQMGWAGVHPEWRDDYLNAVLTKPGPQDLIRYRLREDPNLENLSTDLGKIGIHPDYLDVFRKLAYPIPPLGDLVTMAVRYVFTPEIANRFGLYEEFPDELAHFAAMNGTTDEWARRYWASHWTLPSPAQGLDMLHRGIITMDDLAILMREQNIAPYWRDKLLKAAYTPLNRRDITTMYQLGVLTEEQVNHAYKNVGYDEPTAAQLTETTVKRVMASQTGFNSRTVMAAFKNSTIDRGEAYNLMSAIGVKQSHISQILDRAETERAWTLMNARIDVIANEYRQGLFDAATAKERLKDLHVPEDKIVTLLGRWYKETVERPTVLWTRGETVQFLQRGIIQEDRAMLELKLLGYDDEHIAAIIINAGYVKPPKAKPAA